MNVDCNPSQFPEICSTVSAMCARCENLYNVAERRQPKRQQRHQWTNWRLPPRTRHSGSLLPALTIGIFMCAMGTPFPASYLTGNVSLFSFKFLSFDLFFGIIVKFSRCLHFEQNIRFLGGFCILFVGLNGERDVKLAVHQHSAVQS